MPPVVADTQPILDLDPLLARLAFVYYVKVPKLERLIIAYLLNILILESHPALPLRLGTLGLRLSSPF